MIFFTSDLHINHDRDFIWGARGYEDVIEHNKDIVKIWNEIVSDEDEVYVLGDICLGGGPQKQEDNFKILSQLKGKIHFIIGNHDRISKEKILLAGFESVHKKLLLKYEDKNLVLTHYPQEVENGEICIYGHVHDKPVQLKSKSFCVCVECIGYTPIEINEILRQI